MTQTRGGPICISYTLRGENLPILPHSWAMVWLWTCVIWKQGCKSKKKLECGPIPNVMVALANTGGALCSTPQSLA